MGHLRILIIILLAVLLLAVAGCNASPFTSPENISSAPPETTQPGEGNSHSSDVKIKLIQAYPNLSFVRPVEYRRAEDMGENIFVVEKGGKILVFPNVANVNSAEVFLDLTGVVDSRSNEKGLLGLAFHPDYKNNGLFM